MKNIKKFLQGDKEKIIKTFKNSKENYWKSPHELASATGLTEDKVFKIVMNFDEFVQSSKKSEDGEPLFTTKDNFRQKEPFLNKLIGAFKNRID